MNNENLSNDVNRPECPNGNNPSNDCGECTHGTENHLWDGECVPRGSHDIDEEIYSKPKEVSRSGLDD